MKPAISMIKLLACILIVYDSNRVTQVLTASSFDSAFYERHLVPVEEQNAREYAEERPQQLKQQGHSLVPTGGTPSESRQDGIKKVLVREVDPDGNIVRRANSPDVWRLIQVEQLLDALNGSLPPRPNLLESPVSTSQQAAPIYRTGRTYPSIAFGLQARKKGGQPASGNRWQIPAQSGDNGRSSSSSLPSTFKQGSPMKPWGSFSSGGGGGSSSGGSSSAQTTLEGRPVMNRLPSSSLMGITWSKGKSSTSPAPQQPGVAGPTPYFRGQTAGPMAMGRHKLQSGQTMRQAQPSLLQVQQSGSSTLVSPHHRIGTEEVALHTPIHSHSTSDYEWKRVENNRWNNLRGMWGKRAISERYNNLDNFRDMLETEARNSAEAAAAVAAAASEYSNRHHNGILELANNDDEQQQQQGDDSNEAKIDRVSALIM